MDSDVSGLVARGHGAAGSGPCGNSNECPNILRVSSLNVGTLKGKGDEMMEMLSRRRLDFCCVQETRWKTLVKMIDGKNLMYKYFGSGLGNKFGGVGILLSEKWWENVYEVTRISDRIIAIRLVIGKKVFAIICIYAPQSNLSESNKDEFCHSLQGAGYFPCGVCFNGVGCNSIFCEGFKSWVHKKCCGISGGLKRDPSFRCARCLGTAR